MLSQTLPSNRIVVEAIVQTVAEIKLEATFKHVKGHQDKEHSYASLPLLAQLNMDADKYAGEYRKRCGSHRPVIPLSPTRPIAIDINGKTIHRHLKSAIRDAAHFQPLIDRLRQQHGWPQHLPDLIDWEAHRLSTSGAYRQRQGHLTKLCHGYLPAGKIAHRNKPSQPDWCPLCKAPQEDHQHILQCPDTTRSEWRQKLLHLPDPNGGKNCYINCLRNANLSIRTQLYKAY